MTHADRADEPELLTDRGEDEVGRRVRDLVGVAEAEAGARERRRVPNAYHDCDDLEARRPRGSLPRVEPRVDADLHVAERLVRDDAAPIDEQDQPDDEVRRRVRSPCRASRRTRRRTAATSRGPSGTPSRGSRSPTRGAAGRGARSAGRNMRPMRHAARGEQLAVVDEVRGEEDDEQHLGDLAGLEVERADAHPQPRAVDRRGRSRAAAAAARTTTPSSRNV